MVEINKALAPIWCSMMRVKLHMRGRGLSQGWIVSCYAGFWIQ